MWLRNLFVFFVAAAGILSLTAPAWANDKKKEEKKEPAKEVVVNGDLINADLKDTMFSQSFCKTYVYKMMQGKTYQIDMTSQTLNPYLRLENPEGEAIAQDAGSGGFRNARIVYRSSKTGDYQIVATTQNGGATGKFTLVVKEIVIDDKPIPLKYTNGVATHSGNILATDLRYNNQKIHKLFLIEMEAGKTYKIDHSSRAFDAYLYLESPEGTVLAQNDDNGESLDSRIIHKAAKTGTYRIVATSLGGRGTGAFTLTVRDMSPPSPPKDKK